MQLEVANPSLFPSRTCDLAARCILCVAVAAPALFAVFSFSLLYRGTVYHSAESLHCPVVP
jgi:hypothetical protein